MRDTAKSDAMKGRRVYRCGRCNRAFKKGEERLHSDWSGLSYCTDIAGCSRRAPRFKDRPEIEWRSPKVLIRRRRR